MEPLVNLLLLPIGLGLLGFIEPCSIGASLLFLHYVEGKDPRTKIAQALVFTLTRAGFMGALGVLAALMGVGFVGFQKAGWILLGLLYVALGIVYIVGWSEMLMRTMGPNPRLSGTRGAVGLAILFGLNIPACATPLLFAVLGAAAIGAAGLNAFLEAFVSLALFGFALSLPLMLAVLWSPGRLVLHRAAAWGRRVPIAIGVLLVVLGLWSIYFGLFVSPQP